MIWTRRTESAFWFLDIDLTLYKIDMIRLKEKRPLTSSPHKCLAQVEGYLQQLFLE